MCSKQALDFAPSILAIQARPASPLPRVMLYDALGRDAGNRRQAYRCLFRAAMKETDLKAIRDSLHKGWALGDDRFREEIALLSERRAAPLRKERPRKNKG